MDSRKKRVIPIGVLHLKDAAGNLMYDELPDGKADLTKPCRVRLHGPGSPVFVAEKQALLREGLELSRAKDREKKEDAAMDAIASGSRRVEALIKTTEGWENFDAYTADNEKLIGAAQSRAIYEDPALGYIVEQVDAYVGKWANFMPGLPTA